MGRAIELRTDDTSAELRRLAKRGKDVAQTRRLLAIAAVLDGGSRAEAAKAGGMDRQTLRDWVIRFNEQGPEGLISKPSPGAPGKLSAEHKAFLAHIVEAGPIPAMHGVVRWRACDLIMQLHEKFAISVSDDTVYRALKELGFSHVSARPKAYRQDPEAMKTSGSSCGRTGCRTGFSNPTTTSSITAASPGTRSSTSPGKSCPSPAAIGRKSVNQSENWYYVFCGHHLLAAKLLPARWRRWRASSSRSAAAGRMCALCCAPTAALRATS